MQYQRRVDGPWPVLTRAGWSAKISGYLGKSDKFDKAVGDSVAYADQSERDQRSSRRR